MIIESVPNCTSHNSISVIPANSLVLNRGLRNKFYPFCIELTSFLFVLKFDQLDESVCTHKETNKGQSKPNHYFPHLCFAHLIMTSLIKSAIICY